MNPTLQVEVKGKTAWFGSEGGEVERLGADGLGRMKKGSLVGAGGWATDDGGLVI